MSSVSPRGTVPAYQVSFTNGPGFSLELAADKLPIIDKRAITSNLDFYIFKLNIY